MVFTHSSPIQVHNVIRVSLHKLWFTKLKNFILRSLIIALLILCVRETFSYAYIICQESRYVDGAKHFD